MLDIALKYGEHYTLTHCACGNVIGNINLRSVADNAVHIMPRLPSRCACAVFSSFRLGLRRGIWLGG